MFSIQPLHHQVLGSTYEEKQRTVPFKGDSSQPVDFSRPEDIIPLPPLIDFNDCSDVDMSNILKNMKSLYEYNVFLREKLLSTQSEISPNEADVLFFQCLVVEIFNQGGILKGESQTYLERRSDNRGRPCQCTMLCCNIVDIGLYLCTMCWNMY
ncbi:uncharacterized protein E5676_scaffold648G001670 [Cucumis melo var. makuwa]|uniref:Uncharacterized protein n=1 Tax=Cucumis melo var. makuwa TaxID=1194695 RepID=A0A5D3CDD3_CUCMM|nr:uncharacterized protein E6C27_scaffold115G002140 [Cucumis melo var. makuwa]TYK08356.1 uncharacterized protein E5676_scaffold648G001670 [Cucumis melo var. makuwa]